MSDRPTNPHIRKLNALEERILEIVVTQFIETGDSTRGREIRLPLHSPKTDETLDGLVPDLLQRHGTRPHETYQPTMLGCVHTRWAPGFSLAAERMLGFLRARSVHDPGFQHYDSDEVLESTHLDPKGLSVIRAAIFACGLANGGSHSAKEFRFAVPRDLEALVGLGSFAELLDYRVRVEQEKEHEENSMENPDPPNMDAKKVFVVHGHRDATKHEVARFIESKAGLTAIILDEQPNRGQSILEKLESNSDVGFAVVLFTGDDEGRVKPTPERAAELQPRARQNVVLELGYFVGRLGRGKVCVLYESGVEMPSDYHGIGYIPLDVRGAWKLDLVKELEAAGVSVDSSWCS